MATLTRGSRLDDRSNGYLMTPRVPEGLAAAVESLTREVLRNHPEDIYVFAASHFEKLLHLREEYNISDRKFNDHIGMTEQFIKKDLSSWSRNQTARILKRHRSIFKESALMMSPTHEKSRKSKHSKREESNQKRKISDAELKNPPKIMTGMLAKDIKTELRKNKIISQERNEFGCNRMNKVRDYVVDKFATGDEVQPSDYVEKVQEIINSNEPIIKSKLEVLNKTGLEAKLHETQSLLKDISSCFVKPAFRPRSADSVTTSDKLEAMLTETHNLLVGISSKLFDETNNRTVKTSDVMSTLPSVRPPSANGSVKNVSRRESLVSIALPPISPSNDASKSLKMNKQDLSLPVLLTSESNVESKVETASNEMKEDSIDKESDKEVNASLSDQEIAEQLCYILKEDSACKIPPNVTTVIIPSRPTTGSTDDQFLESFGEKVTVETSESHQEDYQIPVNHGQKHDLQCINEEETADEQENSAKVEKKEEQNELVKDVDNLNEYESTSSAKETSVTDGQGESLKDFGDEETIQSSRSVDFAESSNEAKETTVTDGFSLSLDDPPRPYVPELNLDSLQDITVSSFKMTEDEYDKTPGNEEDNLSTETPILNQPTSEEVEVVETKEEEKEKEKMTSNESDDSNNENVDEQIRPDEEDIPLAVSRSASQCTTRRINSGSQMNLKEDKNDKQITLEESEEVETSDGNNVDMKGDDEKIEETKDVEVLTEIDDVQTQDEQGNNISKSVDSNKQVTDVPLDEILLDSNENLILAVTKIQTGVRRFLARRKLHRMRHVQSTVEDPEVIEKNVNEEEGKEKQEESKESLEVAEHQENEKSKPTEQILDGETTTKEELDVLDVPQSIDEKEVNEKFVKDEQNSEEQSESGRTETSEFVQGEQLELKKESEVVELHSEDGEQVEKDADEEKKVKIIDDDSKEKTVSKEDEVIIKDSEDKVGPKEETEAVKDVEEEESLKVKSEVAKEEVKEPEFIKKKVVNVIDETDDVEMKLNDEDTSEKQSEIAKEELESGTSLKEEVNEPEFIKKEVGNLKDEADEVEMKSNDDKSLAEQSGAEEKDLNDVSLKEEIEEKKTESDVEGKTEKDSEETVNSSAIDEPIQSSQETVLKVEIEAEHSADETTSIADPKIANENTEEQVEVTNETPKTDPEIVEKKLEEKSSEESEKQVTADLEDQAAKTIQNNFRNYQKRKRLHRENAMQKTSTISMERMHSDFILNEMRHTGEIHDTIVLPLFDWKKEEDFLDTDDKSDSQSFTSLEKDVQSEANVDKPTAPGVSVLLPGINPGLSGLLNFVLLSNNIPNQNADDEEEEHQGVIIEEIFDSDDMQSDSLSENKQSDGKVNTGIEEEPAEDDEDKGLADESKSSAKLLATVTPSIELPVLLETEIKDYAAEEFPVITENLRKILNTPDNNSLNVSQDSQLLADDRRDTPETIMQTLPIKSESMQSTDEKKDEHVDTPSLDSTNLDDNK